MPAPDLPAAMARARVAHDRVVTASHELLLACDDVEALVSQQPSPPHGRLGAPVAQLPDEARRWRETADRALELVQTEPPTYPDPDGDDPERVLSPGGRASAGADSQQALGELADRVVRSAFLAGLQLQSLLSATSDPVRGRLEGVVDSLDDLIREVRRVVSGAPG